MEGTIIYANRGGLALMYYLSSEYPWDPYKVKFPVCNMTLEEKCGGVRQLNSVEVETTFSQGSIQSQISSVQYDFGGKMWRSSAIE